MNPDPLESELRRRPIRQIPPEWRSEILQAAVAPEKKSEPAVTSNQSGMPAWVGEWVAWLWPKPVAWAGLAAIWVLLAGLNVSMRQPMGTLQPKYSSRDRTPQGAFAERQLILQEMLTLPTMPSEPGAAPKETTPRTEMRTLRRVA